MKACPICQAELTRGQKVVCSRPCHLESLRRIRIDPVKSAVARRRISFMTRLALADPDVKARSSEAHKRKRT